MANEYLEVANKFGFWIVGEIAVAVVFLRTIIFLPKALSTGRQMGITESRLRTDLERQ